LLDPSYLSCQALPMLARVKAMYFVMEATISTEHANQQLVAPSAQPAVLNCSAPLSADPSDGQSNSISSPSPMTVRQIEEALSAFTDRRARIVQLRVRNHTNMTPRHILVHVHTQVEGEGEVTEHPGVTMNVPSLDVFRAAVSNHRRAAGLTARSADRLRVVILPWFPPSTPSSQTATLPETNAMRRFAVDGSSRATMTVRGAQAQGRDAIATRAAAVSAGVSTGFLDLLWSTCHTLADEEAAALRAQNKGCCPVCLDDLTAGDEILCMPCDGRHVGHWACMKPWLATAASCPCCRFEMQPASGDEGERLIERSVAAAKHVVEDGMAHLRGAGVAKDTTSDDVRCDPCDERAVCCVTTAETHGAAAERHDAVAKAPLSPARRRALDAALEMATKGATRFESNSASSPSPRAVPPTPPLPSHSQPPAAREFERLQEVAKPPALDRRLQRLFQAARTRVLARHAANAPPAEGTGHLSTVQPAPPAISARTVAPLRNSTWPLFGSRRRPRAEWRYEGHLPALAGVTFAV